MPRIFEDCSTNDEAPIRHGMTKVAPIIKTLRMGIAKAPDIRPAGWMKDAARLNPKALDYFTSTIIPRPMLPQVAILTIKHAVLLIGLTMTMMAFVRQCLAN
jgi:hypothetical protein